MVYYIITHSLTHSLRKTPTLTQSLPEAHTSLSSPPNSLLHRQIQIYIKMYYSVIKDTDLGSDQYIKKKNGPRFSNRYFSFVLTITVCQVKQLTCNDAWNRAR